MAIKMNWTDGVVVKGTSANDVIYNQMASNVTIKSGAGKDNIYNLNGSNVKIYGESGNDTINNTYGAGAKIYGGAGNDSIMNNGNNVLISGGAGNDTITNYSGNNGKTDGQYVTISGGKGNDYISFGSFVKDNIIQYANGDGNDTISGFNSDNILHITKGSYKVTTKGKDVIVSVGKGKIILEGAVGKEISIKNSKGKVTTKTYGAASSALLEENNFISADNLSEIVKNNLSPTDYKFDTQNFENLTTENNLITFAEK